MQFSESINLLNIKKCYRLISQSSFHKHPFLSGKRRMRVFSAAKKLLPLGEAGEESSENVDKSGQLALTRRILVAG